MLLCPPTSCLSCHSYPCFDNSETHLRKMWKWFSRCVPGLSLFLLLALLCLAFPDITRWLPHISPWSRNAPPSTDHRHGPPRHPMPLSLSLAQKTFIGYTVLVHFNAFTFVCRLAWALTRMVTETRAVLRRRPASMSFWSPSGAKTPSFSDSPIMTPRPLSTEDSDCFDLGSLEDGEEGEVIHTIILPNYSEDLDTLQTTLQVLASHPRAATQYEVRKKETSWQYGLST
jgi:hypothetical protein